MNENGTTQSRGLPQSQGLSTSSELTQSPELSQTILQVEDTSEGMRLDLYLAKMIPKFSRSFHKNLITTEQVYINGAKEFHPQYRVKPGDEIEIKIPQQP